ncbi:hypothetical protein ACHAWF_015868 [Thalassiosira exigua]
MMATSSITRVLLAIFDALRLAAQRRQLSLCLSLCLLAVAWSSVSAAESGRGGVQLDEDLYNRALAHAATMDLGVDGGIADRLRDRDVEALYEVAKSMNDAGDRISSVLLWHALADDGSEGDDYYAYDGAEGYDYEGHVPSAMALGFSYYDVDKPRSLHYFLMAASKDGAPHQAAMYNAGRLYLELEDPSAALAYVRACATLDRTHPAHARPQLSITCKKAYEELSRELLEHFDMGLEEAVECFTYADFEDFPRPDTKEFKAFDGAMRHLQKYAEMAREKSGEATKGARAKAAGHLSAATEALMNFKSSSGDKMSRLQLFLVRYMLERISDLAAQVEGGSDEL